MAVLEPKDVPGVKDEQACIREAIRNPIGCRPLAEIARGKKTAAIVVNDITRPCPSQMMVASLLDELHAGGIKDEDVTIVIACGNHRPNTPAELEKMLGKDIVSRIKIVNHSTLDDANMRYLGKTAMGTPIYINRHVADADVKITTGLITPHHAAGFSGGRKSILPGVSGIKTLNIHHSLPIRPYEAAMGWLEGNPFHTESIAAARMVGVDFIINTIDNARRGVVAAVAGDLEAAHAQGVKICRSIWEREIPQMADVTVTCPGGFPRDIDMHQSQKAISCAEKATREGGPIILVAECRDGIGKFGGWLKDAKSLEEVIHRFETEGYTAESSNKAFMYARAMLKHPFILVNSGVSKEELASMFITGADSVEEAVAMATKMVGPDAKYLVIPHASDIIPVVSSK
jgi:nickel-dependent lactate racemase